MAGKIPSVSQHRASAASSIALSVAVLLYDAVDDFYYFSLSGTPAAVFEETTPGEVFIVASSASPRRIAHVPASGLTLVY